MTTYICSCGKKIKYEKKVPGHNPGSFSLESYKGGTVVEINGWVEETSPYVKGEASEIKVECFECFEAHITSDEDEESVT